MSITFIPFFFLNAWYSRWLFSTNHKQLIAVIWLWTQQLHDVVVTNKLAH